MEWDSLYNILRHDENKTPCGLIHSKCWLYTTGPKARNYNIFLDLKETFGGISSDSPL